MFGHHLGEPGLCPSCGEAIVLEEDHVTSSTCHCFELGTNEGHKVPHAPDQYDVDLDALDGGDYTDLIEDGLE